MNEILNERMPIKTSLRKEDLPNILSKYSLGQMRDFKTFAHGAGQTTLLVETDEGKSVLRYYENRSNEHVLFELHLFEYLRSKGYPVPKVIKSTAGNLSEEYKGKPLGRLEFIDGEHGKDPNVEFDHEEAVQVVKVVAELHTLTLGYEADYVSNRESLNTDYCLKTTESKSIERREWLRSELATLQIPTGMPRGICHADVNYGNFLFKNNKVTAVLDFDMCFYGDLVYDVANLIYWWAWPPKSSLKLEEAKTIVHEYQKYRPLTNAEKQAIFDYLNLIILLGISWSSDEEFDAEKEKVDALNALGRIGFAASIIG